MIITRLKADFAGREPHLVAYDTPDARRRRRFVRTLLAFGPRAQESVFVLWLSPAQIDEVRHRLRREVDHNEDLMIMVRAGQSGGALPDLARRCFPSPPGPVIL